MKKLIVLRQTPRAVSLSLRKLCFLFLGVCSLGATPQGCDKKNCVEKAPSPDCVCTMQYDPVCGCNGKTYGNACTARCHGITKYVKGQCPDREDKETAGL